MTNSHPSIWTPLAREPFEYEMIPWAGPEYAPWLRASARPHPTDPHRLVLVPERIYQVFRHRQPGTRITTTQLAALRYPRLPDEDELEERYRQQRLVAATGDSSKLPEVHQSIEQLEHRLEEARKAVEYWRRLDPAEVEDRVAWELTHAPHADVNVGIPSQPELLDWRGAAGNEPRNEDYDDRA